MDCERVRQKLSAYIDGDLTFAEKERIEEHLRFCISCQKEMRKLLGLKNLLRITYTILAIEPKRNFSLHWQEVLQRKSWQRAFLFSLTSLVIVVSLCGLVMWRNAQEEVKGLREEMVSVVALSDGDLDLDRNDLHAFHHSVKVVEFVEFFPER